MSTRQRSSAVRRNEADDERDEETERESREDGRSVDRFWRVFDGRAESRQGKGLWIDCSFFSSVKLLKMAVRRWTTSISFLLTDSVCVFTGTAPTFVQFRANDLFVCLPVSRLPSDARFGLFLRSKACRVNEFPLLLSVISCP